MWFLADTGSVATILNRLKFEQINHKLNNSIVLKKTSRILKDFSGNQIHIIGCFRATLASQYAKQNEIIYVTNSMQDENPLLSEDCLLSLGFVAYSSEGKFANCVNSITEDPQDISEAEMHKRFVDLQNQYPKLFDGIGCYKHGVAKITLKPGSTGFSFRSIPCPLHLREAAQAKLKEYVDQGIFKKLPLGYPIQWGWHVPKISWMSIY